MMRSRLVAVVLLTGLASPIVSKADSIARIGPPQNPPPASYLGEQFVDARGCVYMRAGYDGKVTWVPRIDDGHAVLCGYQPTAVAGATLAAAAPQPAAPMAGPAAPAALQDATLPNPQVPPGYRLGWTDGRLNPLAGKGTPAGDAAMYRIWTKTVPMRLRPNTATEPTNIVDTAYEAPAPKRSAAPVARLSTSNMPAAASPAANPAAPAAAAGRYVQVGSFGVPDNATAAVARLQALGLPVALAGGRIGAKPVKVVLAGPFADPQALGAALAEARAAGFGDAFARD